MATVFSMRNSRMAAHVGSTERYGFGTRIFRFYPSPPSRAAGRPSHFSSFGDEKMQSPPRLFSNRLTLLLSQPCPRGDDHVLLKAAKYLSSGSHKSRRPALRAETRRDRAEASSGVSWRGGAADPGAHRRLTASTVLGECCVLSATAEMAFL
ncbi:hypothetical protein Bbelb_366210 [Branchiostoma belcheri]|nr:hypothetical protein Bbelb_391730 [Branchiostoma belcheri]KAI8485602.1 hypothetical protein Bbelb_366210 [Branchiostoma belcheri]